MFLQVHQFSVGDQVKITSDDNEAAGAGPENLLLGDHEQKVRGLKPILFNTSLISSTAYKNICGQLLVLMASLFVGFYKNWQTFESL